MTDRFFHPSGKKSQRIRRSGSRLIRLTGESPSGTASTPENIRRRNRMLEEAAGTETPKVGQREAGVSGYKTPKGDVERGLTRAERDLKPEEMTPEERRRYAARKAAKAAQAGE